MSCPVVVVCLIEGAGVAQLGELLTCNEVVGGSSPLASSIYICLVSVARFPSGQREQTVNLSA